MTIALAITHDLLVGTWQRLLRRTLNAKNPHRMITRISSILFVLALSACASDSPSTDSPAQGTSTAQPADQGTRVNVGTNGVSVESDKGSVELSGDSASIKLP